MNNYIRVIIFEKKGGRNREMSETKHHSPWCRRFPTASLRVSHLQVAANTIIKEENTNVVAVVIWLFEQEDE